MVHAIEGNPVELEEIERIARVAAPTANRERLKLSALRGDHRGHPS
jgi:hypothetical protein